MTVRNDSNVKDVKDVKVKDVKVLDVSERMRKFWPRASWAL